MPNDREILFEGFSVDRKRAFLKLGVAEDYPVQTVILKEGEGGSDMLLVEEGVVSVWVREVKVNELNAESVLGVSTLIEPHPRTASLVAETAVRLRRFERADVLKFMETIPSKLFQQFFVNAFRIHMNLLGRCEERIVRLAHELNAS